MCKIPGKRLQARHIGEKSYFTEHYFSTVFLVICTENKQIHMFLF